MGGQDAGTPHPGGFNEDVEKRHLRRLGVSCPGSAVSFPLIHVVQQTCVRLHLDEEILNIKSAKDLPKRCPRLTAEQFAAYTTASVPVITSRETFTMDLSRPWSFGLNQEAADFFITDFLRAIAGGAFDRPPIPPRYLTREQIARALKGHIDYLTAEFRRLTRELTEEERREQKARAEKRKATTRQSTASTSPIVILR